MPVTIEERVPVAQLKALFVGGATMIQTQTPLIDRMTIRLAP
jgi:hypothetical protein